MHYRGHEVLQVTGDERGHLDNQERMEFPELEVQMEDLYVG